MKSKDAIAGYIRSLGDRQLAPTAIRVAFVVGSILFAINHGWALLQGQMTVQRWISAGLTYCVPYLVNIHGQYISRTRMQEDIAHPKSLVG